jgi:hypothetical protein
MAKYINGETEYRKYLMEMEQEREDVFQPDSVVSSIINEFLARSKKGKAKYGVDLDRTDLSLLEWIEHAKQEHMDAILYLEKIKQTISGKEKNI